MHSFARFTACPLQVHYTAQPALPPLGDIFRALLGCRSFRYVCGIGVIGTASLRYCSATMIYDYYLVIY